MKRNILSIFLCVVMIAAVFATIAVLGNVVAHEDTEVVVPEEAIGENERETDSSSTVIDLVRDPHQIDGTAFAFITVGPMESGGRETSGDKNSDGGIPILLILLIMGMALGASLVHFKLKKREKKFGRILSIGFMLVLVITVFAVMPMNVGATTTLTVDDDWQVGSVPYAEDMDSDNDFATIQAAVNAANHGDTIQVNNGVYNENVVVNKTLTLIGENKDTTIIDGGGIGNVVQIIDVDWVNITGFTITGSGSSLTYLDSGIKLGRVYNCYIAENNVSNNTCGITLSHSPSGNNIVENNIVNSNTNKGIYLNGSYSNIIKNNTLLNNNEGIELSWSKTKNNIIVNNIFNSNQTGIMLSGYSTTNTIINNTCSENSSYGISLIQSSNNKIINNTCIKNNNGINLSSSSNNNTIENNRFNLNNSKGIMLSSSSNNWIENNICNLNVGPFGAGIELYKSSFNTIINNTIDSNSPRGGIYFQSLSENSRIENNIISNNNLGININRSSNNLFIHNNFIDNMVQVYMWDEESINTWDNGADEGNYWSDYIGLDDGTGGRVAGDGIGDTNLPHPYTDQGNGYHQLDNYPFMYENGWGYGTTPTGSNVPVPFPEDGATLTFPEVISGGTTTCTVTETGPPPPTGFKLVPSHPPTYYEITTTATFTGMITICINYDDSGLEPGQENNLNLRQYDEATSEWVVITTSLNIDDNIICGETAHLSFFAMMLRLNDPPEANTGGPYDSVEGSEITFDASDSTDPNGDLLQYRWDFDNDGNWDTDYSIDPTATHTWYDDYSGTIKVEVYDGKDTDTDIATVIVNNVAPTATLCNNGPKTESSTVTALFTNQYDPGTFDTFTYSFDWDNDGTYEIVDQAGASAQYTWYDNGVYTVKGKIKDNNDGYSEYTTDITVNNIAPTITSIEGPVYPVQVGTSVDLTGTFTDPGTLDTHTWEINWGDKITFGDVIGYTVTEFHTYTEAGVYTIKLKVTDDDGDSDSMEFKYAVVYDPEGGFVTGGGWIGSPAGAYVADPELEGKANFGFVSKYKKGATTPTGNTEFQFKAGDLNFHSSDYDWLVVAGARAQFKGRGTINGEGNYGFMLTAIDGEINGGGGADKFRIKIWYETVDELGNEIEHIVYDNGEDPENGEEVLSELGGGQIVIHTKGK